MPSREVVKDLTDLERGQIIGLRRADATFREISENVGHTKSTVKNVYYGWKQDGSIKSKCPGRPPILLEREC